VPQWLPGSIRIVSNSCFGLCPRKFKSCLRRYLSFFLPVRCCPVCAAEVQNTPPSSILVYIVSFFPIVCVICPLYSWSVPARRFRIGAHSIAGRHCLSLPEPFLLRVEHHHLKDFLVLRVSRFHYLQVLDRRARVPVARETSSSMRRFQLGVKSRQCVTLLTKPSVFI
jgi:hypothetical protein